MLFRESTELIFLKDTSLSECDFLILGGPKSRNTPFHVEKCVILHFSGGPDAHRLSKNLSLP